MKRRLLAMSPLGILSLAACSQSQTGFALKGPISGAIVFADANDNGILDDGETSVRTEADGSYEINNPNNYTLVLVGDASTVDTVTGQSLDGVSFSAPSSSEVITPFTTLVAEGVDAEALANALGLDGVDLLTYNPFDGSASDADKLAYEKLSAQVVSIVEVLGDAIDSESGGDGGSSAAFDALIAAVSEALANGDDIDFSDATFLEAVLDEAGDAVSADDLATLTATLVSINEAIDELDTLEGDDAIDILTEAFDDDPDDETPDDETPDEPVNEDPVLSVVENDSDPDDGTVYVSSSEVGGAVVGQVSATDAEDDADDSDGEVTFSISGEDADNFEIVDGVLKFKDDVDPEAGDEFAITIVATDSDGATDTQDLSVIVQSGVPDAPVELQIHESQPELYNLVEENFTGVGEAITEFGELVQNEFFEFAYNSSGYSGVVLTDTGVRVSFGDNHSIDVNLSGSSLNPVELAELVDDIEDSVEEILGGEYNLNDLHMAELFDSDLWSSFGTIENIVFNSPTDAGVMISVTEDSMGPSDSVNEYDGVSLSVANGSDGDVNSVTLFGEFDGSLAAIVGSIYDGLLAASAETDPDGSPKAESSFYDVLLGGLTDGLAGNEVNLKGLAVDAVGQDNHLLSVHTNFVSQTDENIFLQVNDAWVVIDGDFPDDASGYAPVISGLATAFSFLGNVSWEDVAESLGDTFAPTGIGVYDRQVDADGNVSFEPYLYATVDGVEAVEALIEAVSDGTYDLDNDLTGTYDFEGGGSYQLDNDGNYVIFADGVDIPALEALIEGYVTATDNGELLPTDAILEGTPFDYAV